MASNGFDWITVNGNHIPVGKGESKKAAYERAFKERKNSDDGQVGKGYNLKETTVYGVDKAYILTSDKSSAEVMVTKDSDPGFGTWYTVYDNKADKSLGEYDTKSEAVKAGKKFLDSKAPADSNKNSNTQKENKPKKADDRYVPKTITRSKTLFSEDSIEMENGSYVGLKNVKLDKTKMQSKEYPDLVADLDVSRTRLEKGDSIGLRMLGSGFGMRNVDVYGRVDKIGANTITINHPRGTKYVISTKNVQLKLTGNELRLSPKDSSTDSWFAFIDLDSTAAKDYLEKARKITRHEYKSRRKVNGKWVYEY